MKKSNLNLVMVSVLSGLFLTACADDKPTAVIAETIASEDDTATAVPSEHTQMEAYNYYIRAGNRMTNITGFGTSLPEAFKKYSAQKLGSAQPTTKNPKLYLSHDVILHITEYLQQAIALNSGGYNQELDTIAPNLLQTAERLNKLAEELDLYLKSKAYLEDNFELIRSKNNEFERLFEQFIQEATQYQTALMVAEDKVQLIFIQELKDNGQTTEVAKHKAIRSANIIVNLINRNDNLSESRIMEQVDAEIENIEKQLNHLRGNQYTVARTQLTSFIDSWQEYKSTQNPARLSGMIQQYNAALR